MDAVVIFLEGRGDEIASKPEEGDPAGEEAEGAEELQVGTPSLRVVHLDVVDLLEQARLRRCGLRGGNVRFFRFRGHGERLLGVVDKGEGKEGELRSEMR